ncbi:hypothetical protein J2W23_006193 [Variovorax boronicumulans]|uniref:hypothetical protein n=1 Tax=Variovorax boronicumulans TaxID=436515 RepID=UPI00278566F1|nr:hypothetical protein [Variovorax boronicumulans]MDQ0017779.1 hypothetical protein [Variovorax boronicumulans]
MKADSTQSIFISAVVIIFRTATFDEFIKNIAQVTGLQFNEETSGRYDEIPAYEASTGEVNFLLLGPQDEEDEEYRLEVICNTNSPLNLLIDQSGEFVRSFIHEKPMNAQGFMDFSQELADALMALGIRCCRSITAED